MDLSPDQFELAISYSRHIQSNHLINEVARKNAVFNHIRLGDGEAKILGYPKYVSRGILDTQLKIWFGNRSFSEAEIHSIRTNLIQAIQKCSVVGLPTAHRINNGLKNGPQSLDARMCTVLYLSLTDEKIEFESKAVDASSHFWLQSSKSIKNIIANKRVLFISKSSDIGDRFVTAGLIEDYEVLVTPAETWSRTSPSSTHYPEVFERIVGHIQNCPINCNIAIIGAGPLGKIYSNLLKEKLVSSVDMGSIIDAWTDTIPDKRVSLKKNEKFRLNWLT